MPSLRLLFLSLQARALSPFCRSLAMSRSAANVDGDHDAPVLPPDWVVCMSKRKKRRYYFNQVTGDTSWQPPTCAKVSHKAFYLCPIFRFFPNYCVCTHNAVKRTSSHECPQFFRDRYVSSSGLSKLLQNLPPGYFLGIIRCGPMSLKFDGPFL